MNLVTTGVRLAALKSVEAGWVYALGHEIRP